MRQLLGHLLGFRRSVAQLGAHVAVLHEQRLLFAPTRVGFFGGGARLGLSRDDVGLPLLELRLFLGERGHLRSQFVGAGVRCAILARARGSAPPSPHSSVRPPRRAHAAPLLD